MNMKNQIWIIVLLFSVLSELYAQSVTLVEATAVAENFLSKSNLQKNTSNCSLYQIKVATPLQKSTKNTTYYYVFNTDSSFVVVGGDKRMLPILAYSTANAFDTTNLPANVKYWFETYQKELDYVCKIEESASKERINLWNQYINNTIFQETKRQKSVEFPLLTTTWNQAPYYNDLCPYDSNYQEHAVTGCVATAMAQILKYWNYPQNGEGSYSYIPTTNSYYGTLSANFANTTYQWADMPKKLNSNSSSSSKNAVATLMYHCGVSVAMDYNVSSEGGSGAYSLLSQEYIDYGYRDVPTALKTHFKYSNVVGKYKEDYTNSDWITMLKNELDNGRPIYYAGSGDGGGHAFVCDGYDADDRFHFNFGWGGAYDGYFFVSSIDPIGTGIGGGTGGGFSENQRAIINIYPDSIFMSDLRLYSNMIMKPSTIVANNESFSIAVCIANYGSNDFSGSYAIGIFDSIGNFCCWMDNKSNKTLRSMYYDSIIFSTTGLSMLTPGTYFASVCYQQGGISSNKWFFVEENDFYSNLLQFKLTSPINGDIQMADEISIVPKDIEPESQFTISAKIANYSSYKYIGGIKVCIYKDNTLISTIEEINDFSLPKGFQVIKNFTCTGLPEGSYSVKILYSINKQWIALPNGNYSSTKKFEVKSTVDIVEPLLNQVIVCPNPAKTMLTIENATENVQIFDISGRLLINVENKETNLLQINVANLANGLYFVKIGNYTTKFVKE